MKQRIGRYPSLGVDGQGSSVVPNAGAVLLLCTAEAVSPPQSGQDPAGSRGQPGVGGDCLADLAQLRTAPEVFGPVAFDPTVSRLIHTLAAAVPAALAAIASARATARATALWLAGERAPDHDRSAASPVVIDVDATLVTAHSQKESAAPRAPGSPWPFALRPGNAGSNTVACHIAVLRAALAQLPGGHACGKKALVRIDGAGGTHELLAWLTRRQLAYSVGFSLPGDL